MKTIIIKYGSNKIEQLKREDSDELLSVQAVANSWQNVVSLRKSSPSVPGLRPAQFGALCAIRAHWTVSNDTATIVMPTGTGKTETMIATVVSEQIERSLIIVPSDMLRRQTAIKFLNFGILRQISIIDKAAASPAVCLLKAKPQGVDELQDILEKSNVIVTTMSLLKSFSDEFFNALKERIQTYIIDEAHHIAAGTWASVKHKLSSLRCLQFTATPFRNDGKKMDGKIIYNFPLALAQEQGYFQPIQFSPIWEYDEENADRAIAQAALNQLQKDIAAGYNHTVLVRAKDKKTADRLFSEIYSPLCSEFKPVLIHSGVPSSTRNASLKALKEGVSRVVICVDMFGEGIDISTLKIAAMHDKYKSLPITLQFIGRFARTDSGLGPATFITNIANDDLNNALCELYAQDSDWNKLLPTLSSEAIDQELSLQELAEGFDHPDLRGLTIQQLRPKISMAAYAVRETEWNVDKVYSFFGAEERIISINNDQKIVVVIEKNEESINWTTYKGINDIMWNMHLVYWNPKLKLCYINSTVKNLSDELANAIFPSAQRIKGENVFRCLSGIKRLLLGTVGLKSAIDGPIKYRMFAGLDIGNGIAESQKETSFKSNLFGVGFEGNGQISIGCSYKGRIWAKWVESIDYWMKWCDSIAIKLIDDSINTGEIFKGALIPEIISSYPNSIPYMIEWPLDLSLQTNDNVRIFYDGKSYPLYDIDIRLETGMAETPLVFSIGNGTFIEKYGLRVSQDGFKIYSLDQSKARLLYGKKDILLVEYFNKNQPQIKFVDQSTLEGNILVRLNNVPQVFSTDSIEAWDWGPTDIQIESQTERRNPVSIQYHVIDVMKRTDQYSVIFDDDGAGEVADIVGIIDDKDRIEIHLFHCKYAHGEKKGSRVADLYEVCGQAEKSVKWCAYTGGIIERLIKREVDRSKHNGTRIEIGSLRKLRELQNKLKRVPACVKINIVQPGVDSAAISTDMARLLNGTAAYLLDTYGIQLKLICS